MPGEERALAVPEPTPDVIIVTPDMVLDPDESDDPMSDWVYFSEVRNGPVVTYKVWDESTRHRIQDLD